MPTLIELSPEEFERLGVSQLFEVSAPSNGERHPEFIRRPGEEWDWNGNHNYVSTGAHKESGSYRFARRATPSEIAAQAPSVGRDVHQFFAAQGEWSQATFGLDSERGCIGPLKHLEKEAREAYTETDREKRHMEIVDCFFLTCDSARRDGMSFDDLLALAWKKLEINKARQWSKPTSDEPVEHVRNEGAPQ
jgi:hypothetical protein